MSSRLGPEKRFALTLLAIYALTMPVISVVTYYVLKEGAVREAYEIGQVHLCTIEAVKQYVSEELRPVFYEEMPGRFVLEGMSRSYVAGKVARRVNREYPEFRYINASLSPKNPVNTADPFEAKVIEAFARDRQMREWRGFRTTQEGEFYVIARAGEPFGEGCLYCHGDPGAAPVELIEAYGTEAGFHMQAGQLADAKFIYIPIGVPLGSARKAVGIFIGIYTAFFGGVLLVIHARFRRLYGRIDSYARKLDSVNADLSEMNSELETMVAERTMSLMALTVADRVRNPAAVIGWICRRMLDKEKVSDSLCENLNEVIGESGKLETIVKDFEALLKTKRSMFSHDDINDIFGVVVPLVEKAAEEKGVRLELDLSPEPLKINLQKNLLKVAMLHLIRNALDATPEGGRITVKTSGDKDSVFVTISDTGTGMSEEELKRVFDPFFSTKRFRYGMGLPLVKQIVSEHLGSIRVESEPGKGTTFRMTFPVRWLQKPA
jgi:signal transduction histidine kinase